MAGAGGDALRELVCEVASRIRVEASELVEEGVRAALSRLRGGYERGLVRARRVIEEAAREGAGEAARVVSMAEVEAKKIRLLAQDEVIRRAIDEFYRRLNWWRREGWYRELVRELVREGVEAVGNRARVRPARPDAGLVAEVVRELNEEMGLGLELGDPVESAGGVVVESLDGRIVYENTVEARLRKVRREVRMGLSRILVGSDGGG